MRRNAIFLIVLIDLLGFGLILPMLPFAGQSLGATPLYLGLLAAAFPFAQVFAMPVWGRAADRFGRRPIILISTAGSIVAYLIFANATSFALLLFSRFFAGLVSANLGVAKASLADLSDDKTLAKNMGLYGAAQALGFLLGPAFGSALSHGGIGAVGYWAAALSAVSLVFSFAVLPETRPSGNRIPTLAEGDVKKSRAIFFGNPRLVRSCLALFLTTLAFSHLFIAFPLFLQARLDYGSRETGEFFVLLSVVGILIQGIAYGKLVKKISPEYLILTGLLIMAGGLFVFSSVTSLGFTVAFVVVVAGGYSLANPAILAAIAQSGSADEQGFIAGVSESASGVARVLGPLLAGALISGRATSPAFVSAAACALAALVASWPRLGVRARLLSPRALSPENLREFFLLFQIYYQDVTWERFTADLAEKTHLLVFEDIRARGAVRLVGFTTILLGTEIGDTSIFSGDTVIHEDFWGGKVLQKSFSKFLVRTKLRNPHRRVYWMLMSKGYKTYLLMRHNFPRSYPNAITPTPASAESFKNTFYGAKFGSAFDPGSSRIHFPEPHGSVRGTIADADATARENSEVRFFLERNPRYAEGDELACIAEIRLRDVVHSALRYAVSALRVGREGRGGAPRKRVSAKTG